MKNALLILTLGMPLLTGCQGPPAFSYDTQAKGNAACAELYQVSELQTLSIKMPLLPGKAPTREMLNINEVPTENERRSLQILDTALQNCRATRAAAGIPTSASEDILEARTRRLRTALMKGQIPYGVYNYGLAKALKPHSEFLQDAEESHSRANTIGWEKLWGY